MRQLAPLTGHPAPILACHVDDRGGQSDQHQRAWIAHTTRNAILKLQPMGHRLSELVGRELARLGPRKRHLPLQIGLDLLSLWAGG